MSYKIYDSRIQYIEGTGTQYIDTLYSISSLNVKIDSMWMQTEDPSTFVYFAGQDFDYSNYRFGFYSNANNKIAAVYGNKYAASSISSDRNIHHFTLDKNVLYRDDSAIVSNASSTFYSNNNTVLLFTYLPSALNIKARLYYLKLYENDILVRDMIPVRVGQEGYLYDRITHRLYGNAGTGNFVLGNDVPFDIEVEYIESTGEQHVDTGYHLNSNNFKYSITYQQTADTSVIKWIMRQYNGDSNYNYAIYCNASNKLSAIYGGYWAASTTNSDRNVHTLTYGSSDRKLYRDGTAILTLNTSSVPLTGNNTVHLLGMQSDPAVSAKIYHATIYHNGVLVRDMFPVRRNDTGYMYDIVTNQIFGNVGTGSLILGKDVANDIPEVNEVAFLESWGNQYIDTGIKPSTDTKIELKCLYCKSGAGLTNYGALIGADDRDNAYILNHSAVANFTYGLEFSNNFANPQTRLLTFDSTASPQNMRVYDEGGSLVTTLTCIRGVFEVNQNLYLFATNRNGTPVYGSNRILYCKIYDGDTLVRDYVPVEYNGIGYMYDKVSGLFFDNQGTGKFLFGSIAKACARSYSRRQLMSFKLPYDAEIEYLQSTGTQYINTGKTFKSNIRVVFSVIYTQTVTQYNQTWGLNRSGYEVLWGGGYFWFGGKKTTYSNPVKDTEYEYDYDFTAGKMVAKINNTIVQSTSGTQPNASEAMYIFALNYKSSRNYYKAKHGEFKLYENGVISLDLIPVRVGNVGYMYDKVSKQLFGNAGTGSFILGPDKH